MRTRVWLASAVLGGLCLLPAACDAPPTTAPKGGFSAEDEKDAVALPSGLKYVEIRAGDGPAAKAGDVVEVHYTGWLKSNGKKFDSSVDRDEPFPFPLGARRVVKGWDEGVAGMKVGGKRRLFIPSALAYGPEGSPPDIPPNADLVFDVELLKIRQ
jgi:FKBP-type peptidyl-prolyl cis-trans isomerase